MHNKDDGANRPAPGKGNVPELLFTEDGVVLTLTGSSQPVKFNHSFLSNSFQKRLLQSNQALFKACRNKKRSIQTILDLTGGWGIDSFLLASHGYRVTMLEQNETIFQIVSRSMAEAKTKTQFEKTLRNLDSIHANALDFLNNPDNRTSYDCIYLDPMFPQHKSKAKPAKDMQVLQALTENIDIGECARIALTRASNRVVIKRPAKAPALIENRPADLVYREKTIRFDVYLSAVQVKP